MATGAWPRPDSAKHEAERNAEKRILAPGKANRAAQTFAVRTARFEDSFSDNVAKGVVVPARLSFVELTGSRFSPAARTAGTAAPLPPARIPCRFRAQHPPCPDHFRVAATSRCQKRAARRAPSESRS